MNDTPSPPAQPGRIMWGRIISLAGAAGLCVSFFLPNIDIMTTGAPVELIGNTSLLPLAKSSYIVIPPFIGAALLLPVLAFRASPHVDASKSGGTLLAWAQCVISLAVLILSLAWVTWMLVDVAFNPPASVLAIVYAIAAEGFLVLVLTVMSLIRSRLARKAAATLFALWSYYLVFFICLATTHGPFYIGLWLSLAASGALVIGSAIDWFQCRPVKETLR